VEFLSLPLMMINDGIHLKISMNIFYLLFVFVCFSFTIVVNGI
jgi:hypothetical protein